MDFRLKVSLISLICGDLFRSHVINRIYLVILSILLCENLSAYNMDVLDFKYIEMDLSAKINERKDYNGLPCAMIKISFPTSDATFEGNLVGTCDYKTNEYWCYLSPGSKQITIKYPYCEPLNVTFSDWGYDKLQSNSVYRLTINIPKIV